MSKQFRDLNVIERRNKYDTRLYDLSKRELREEGLIEPRNNISSEYTNRVVRLFRNISSEYGIMQGYFHIKVVQPIPAVFPLEKVIDSINQSTQIHDGIKKIKSMYVELQELLNETGLNDISKLDRASIKKIIDAYNSYVLSSESFFNSLDFRRDVDGTVLTSLEPNSPSQDFIIGSVKKGFSDLFNDSIIIEGSAENVLASRRRIGMGMNVPRKFL